MINATTPEGNFGEGEAKNPISSEKLKEYGMKAYHPILNVLYKYQDEFTPYLRALVKGLRGGMDVLSKESVSEQERYVGQFFSDAANSITQVSEKLSSKDINALKNFIEEQGRKRPSVMFSASYLAGVFLGRVGRHLGKSKSESSSSFESFNEDDLDIGQGSFH